MCWVMPPASPPATSAFRMRSRRLVLPWSTWPMTVTTGGRVSSPSVSGAASSSPRASAMVCSSLLLTSSTSQPNSLARSFAVSASSVVLMCTLAMPIERSLTRSSVAFRLMRWAIVWRVMSLSMRMTFLWALISCVETIAGLRGCMGPDMRRRCSGPSSGGRAADRARARHGEHSARRWRLHEGRTGPCGACWADSTPTASWRWARAWG